MIVLSRPLNNVVGYAEILSLMFVFDFFYNKISVRASIDFSAIRGNLKKKRNDSRGAFLIMQIKLTRLNNAFWHCINVFRVNLDITLPETIRS